MAVPVQLPTVVTEASSPIVNNAGGTALADLVQMYSAQLVATIVRQAMAIGDPLDARAVAKVANLIPDGSEYGVLVRQASGAPDLQNIANELRLLRAEMQQLLLTFSAIPVTPPPICDGNILQ